MNIEIIVSGFFVGVSIVLFSHLATLRKKLRKLQYENYRLGLINECLERRIGRLRQSKQSLFLELVNQIKKYSKN